MKTTCSIRGALCLSALLPAMVSCAGYFFWTGEVDNSFETITGSGNWKYDNASENGTSASYSEATKRLLKDHVVLFKDRSVAFSERFNESGRQVEFSKKFDLTKKLEISAGSAESPIQFVSVGDATNGVVCANVFLTSAGYMKALSGEYTFTQLLVRNGVFENVGGTFNGTSSLIVGNQYGAGTAVLINRGGAINLAGGIQLTSVTGSKDTYDQVTVITNFGGTITATGLEIGSNPQNVKNKSYVGHVTMEGGLMSLSGPVTIGGYNTESCGLYLNGGVLETTQVVPSRGSGHFVFFNGGTLRAAANSIRAEFFKVGDGYSFLVGENGGTIDAGGQNIQLDKSLESALVSGTDGGMTFTGGGKVQVDYFGDKTQVDGLKGGLMYSGPTKITPGTTVWTVNRRLAGTVATEGLVCKLTKETYKDGVYTLFELDATKSDTFTEADLARCRVEPADLASSVKFKLSENKKSILAEVKVKRYFKLIIR